MMATGTTHRSLRRSTLWAFLCCVACQGGSDDALLPPGEFGFTVVSNGVLDPAVRPPFSVDTAPMVSIGAREGPAYLTFGNVNDVAGLPDGRIALYDYATFSLHLYDPSGKWLRTWGGRSGEGPGEFSSPGKIAVVAPDTIIVAELLSRRVSIFNADSGFVSLISLSADSLAALGDSGERVTSSASLSGGGTFLLTARPDQPRTFGNQVSGPTDSLRHIWADRSLRELRRLGRWPSSGSVSVTRPNADGSVGSYLILALPENSRTVAVTDGSGERACIANEYRPVIRCYDRDGGGVVISWEAEYRPLTDSTVQAWKERSLVTLGRSGVTGAEAIAMLNAAPLPEHGPVFRSGRFAISDDLSLWLQVLRPDNGDSRSVAYAVFDREGHYEGTIRMPTGLIIRRIASDHILGTVSDEDGVTYVVKLRLSRER